MASLPHTTTASAHAIAGEPSRYALNDLVHLDPIAEAGGIAVA